MVDFYTPGTDQVFDASLPYTLIEEDPVPGDLTNIRNYSNDRFDPGGMTMDGIIQREYDPWRRKWGLPTQWVRKITAPEVQTIYHEGYWVASFCHEIPAGLSLCVFDTSVNQGVHVGVVLLQRSIGVADDGQFGPKTAEAANSISPVGMPGVIQEFYALRAAYYRRTRNFGRYGGDWLRRDLHIEQASLKLYNHFTTGQAIDGQTTIAAKPNPDLVAGKIAV